MDDTIHKIKSEIFENPITGEVEKLTVSSAFTATQLEGLKDFGMNPEDMINNAIDRELERSKKKKFIKTIADYAREQEDGVKKGTIIVNEAAGYQFVRSIMRFVFSCKSPVIYTNACILTLIHDVLQIKNMNNTSCYAYLVGDLIYTKDDEELKVPVYLIPDLPWNQAEALIFDDEDRTHSQIIEYTISDITISENRGETKEA